MKPTVQIKRVESALQKSKQGGEWLPLTDQASRHEIILTGAIASMVKLALGDGARRVINAGCLAFDRDLFLRSVKVVAGARFERAAFRL